MKKLIIIIISVSCSVIVYGQTVLTLKEYKELAIKNNISIKNSLLETEASKQVKKGAFTNYFPKISVMAFAMKAKDPLLKFNTQGGNLPVYDGNPANIPIATQFAYLPGSSIQMLDKTALGLVNVTQPIFSGGRIITGNKLAKVGIAVKEQQQKLTQNDVLLKTEQQYWQILSLQEKEKTVEKYEAFLEGINKQVNDAFKSGLIIKNDLLKVQIKKNELNSNKSKLHSGKKLAIMQFCQTIGIPYDSTLVLQEDLQKIELPQSYYIENETALQNRTEYQLLEQSVKAQELQTKMKTGDYLPQVAVGAMGYYNNNLIKDVDGTTNGLVYATVSIPITDWWGGSHAIKEQKIKEQIAENTLTDTKGLLKLQIEKAWVDLNENYKQIILLEETVKQAEENLKVMQTSYNSGVITLSDLLEAQALLTETNDKLIDTKTQYRTSISTYLQYTGR